MGIGGQVVGIPINGIEGAESCVQGQEDLHGRHRRGPRIQSCSGLFDQTNLEQWDV
jgi:hypothetical protein